MAGSEGLDVAFAHRRRSKSANYIFVLGTSVLQLSRNLRALALTRDSARGIGHSSTAMNGLASNRRVRFDKVEVRIWIV